MERRRSLRPVLHARVVSFGAAAIVGTNLESTTRQAMRRARLAVTGRCLLSQATESYSRREATRERGLPGMRPCLRRERSCPLFAIRLPEQAPQIRRRLRSTRRVLYSTLLSNPECLIQSLPLPRLSSILIKGLEKYPTSRPLSRWQARLPLLLEALAGPRQGDGLRK